MKRAVLALLMLFHAALAAAASVPNAHQEPTRMHAKGTFDVTVKPQQPDNDQARAAGLARLSLDKRFAGALAATSQGEMLASGGGSSPSGAYVALERVSGTLDGREGSFVLLHSAMMTGGVPRDWSVKVVPDSGTGKLAGLSGSMTITIADGKHFYDFAYELPEL